MVNPGIVGLTGSSGFLGAAIAKGAPSETSIITFGRSGADRKWNFADESPADISGLSALIHCAWDTSSRNLETAALNVQGSKRLYSQARDAGIPFIFISSMSSRAQTKSTYGSSKYAVEAALEGDSKSRILRPGVIRDADGNVGLLTATLDKVAGLPVNVRVSPDPKVPLTSLDRVVQEVWQSLDSPFSSGPIVIVDEWIALDALVSGRRNAGKRVSIPVPRALISAAVATAGLMPSDELRNLADSWRGLQDLSC